MKHFLITILCLCPIWVQAQSEKEILQAMETFDYEIPIERISPASGDSVLTPLRAQSLEAMNRYAEALKEWNSLLLPDSANTKILNKLAECYRKINRNDMAVRCYKKSVSLNPENKFFRQQHIQTLLSMEDYESAVDAAHGWLENDTISAMGYKFLGMAYKGLSKENPDALVYANFALYTAYTRDPEDGQTVALLASLFNESNQYEDALEVTESYRQTDTLNVDVNRQNAKAYCLQKNYDKAIERYEALKALGDRSFTTLYYLGISHYGKESMYEAQANLSQAHLKNPTDVNLLYYLAKSCARTSWKKEGVDYMKEAIEIAIPTDSMVMTLYEGLADCYGLWNEGDPYEYIEILKKTYSLNKKYTIYYKIAEVYERQKDYANAIHYYEKYMALVPKDKQVVFDSDGQPSKKTKTWYQMADMRIKKMKEESFFRDGVK